MFLTFRLIADKKTVHTEPVGRVPLEQSPEQWLGLCAQELRHSQTRPAETTRMEHSSSYCSRHFFTLQHAETGFLRSYSVKNTHFRIRFIVSFRSFPWNGSAPVSISNWGRDKAKIINSCYTIIYASTSCVWNNLNITSHLPWVLQTTTSRRCGCVPACWRPLGPCTPQSRRRNRPFSHGRLLLCTNQNLENKQEIKLKDLLTYTFTLHYKENII